MAKGFAPVPSLPLFMDFCAAKVVGRLPAGLRRPQRDAVLRIEPLEGTEGPGGWRGWCMLECGSARPLGDVAKSGASERLAALMWLLHSTGSGAPLSTARMQMGCVPSN